ncbi:hypothetical protein CCAX7_24060 [Capsulimonas corticalis]|uniref:YtkA-like domain-containing protein n=1 Tax=Capsulimonas corticalis TaxID=2219043 RepID=A0A402CVC7_9BACT|nr:FixH family protein [Capsulimonas corticalis]BDI30355.1 hypothetical protein CCAX7_24060 [Capsulimonas corticalis]
MLLKSFRQAAAPLAVMIAIPALAPRVARAHATEFSARQGDIVGDLRAPAEGVSAGDETAFSILVMRVPPPDPSNKDALPFLFGAGLPCKTVSCRISMPAMAGMPQIAPTLTPSKTAGVYNFTATFPHGGQYRFDVAATPADGGAPIALRYDVAVGDALDPSAAPYRLVVSAKPARPRAGQSVTMALSVVDSRTGQRITDFETVHEKKMHFIMVRDDLGDFSHEHPVLQPDGTFTHTTTFPTSGTWRLYADMAPKNAGAQLATASIDVSGPAPSPFTLTAPAPPVSKGAPLAAAQDDEIQATLSAPLLAARQDANLTVQLTDKLGAPVTQLEPWLGAPAHMVLISQRSHAFVHSHPADWGAGDQARAQLHFVLRLPESGLYRGWLQFQRAGVLHTLPFTVRVAPHPI